MESLKQNSVMEVGPPAVKVELKVFQNLCCCVIP